jgi:hypothetical protein
MYLADPEEVRDMLGFESMADINNAIADALDTATALLASQLTSSFDLADYTDYFWVPEESQISEFRLSTGFATLTAVALATTIDQFGTTAEVTYTSDVQLNSEKGVVKDHVTRYDRVFVKVTYSAGFDPDGTDPKMYELSQVPKWLQDAAKTQCKLLLADHPSLTEANIKFDTKALRAQLSSILGSRIRYAPAAYLPV